MKIVFLILIAFIGSGISAAQTPSPSDSRPVSTIATYFTAALEFVASIRTNVETYFTTPAIREDALQKLDESSTLLAEIIKLNNQLQVAIALKKWPDENRIVQEITQKADTFRNSLETVLQIVPASDRSKIAPYIHEMQTQFSSKTIMLSELYEQGNQTLDPQAARTMLEKAGSASELALQVQDKLNQLITELANTTAK